MIKVCKIKSRLLFVLVLVSQTTFAQLKGIVKDSISNNGIPFVNIWVYNENIGTTANENGEFILPQIKKNKILVFSAIGYKSKRITYKLNLGLIYLQKDTIELQEVVVNSKQKHKEIKIGKFKKSTIRFYYACNGTPWIHARFFPYKTDYIKTPYLKNITFLTQSDIKNAKFIIRLYIKTENSLPEQYLYNKNIIGIAKKGDRRTKVDLSSYKIRFPENGFFVSVEWLIIEENKYEFTYKKRRGAIIKHKAISYEPSIGTVPETTNKNAWIFQKGLWDKPRRFKTDILNKYYKKFPVLACELTLTN